MNLTTAQYNAIMAGNGGSPVKARRPYGSVKAARVAKQRAKAEAHRQQESRLVRCDRVFMAEVHVATPNPVNGAHGTPWSVHKIRVAQRAAVASALMAYGNDRPRLPVLVKLKRRSTGTMDDDNLRPALKKIRDSIADWLLVDDGDTKQVQFIYGQEIGQYGVRIEIRPVDANG